MSAGAIKEDITIYAGIVGNPMPNIIATIAESTSAMNIFSLDNAIINEVNFRPKLVKIITPTIIPAQALVRETLITLFDPFSRASNMASLFITFYS